MINEGIEESELLANTQKSDYDEDEQLRQVLEMSLHEENDRQNKLASIKEQAVKKPNVVPVTVHFPEPDLRNKVITNISAPFKPFEPFAPFNPFAPVAPCKPVAPVAPVVPSKPSAPSLP